MTEPTRGRWNAHPGQISDHYDIYTDESEGMIAQNVRWEDARLIAASKQMLAILQSIVNGHPRSFLENYSGIIGLELITDDLLAAHDIIDKVTGKTV